MKQGLGRLPGHSNHLQCYHPDNCKPEHPVGKQVAVKDRIRFIARIKDIEHLKKHESCKGKRKGTPNELPRSKLRGITSVIDFSHRSKLRGI